MPVKVGYHNDRRSFEQLGPRRWFKVPVRNTELTT
uniref:Uncharacterized protein n=1 Tax=Anguilla anguilla TaxID=7936 RepID=A0A0E9V1D2_ANGAN